MEHSDAVQLSAVEKYLLDELPPEQRDQFEEHYFGCPECAEDLRATATFLDLAKVELQAHRLPKPSPDLQAAPQSHAAGPKLVASNGKKASRLFILNPAFLVPALAASLLVVAYQNIVVLPRVNSQVASLRTAEVLPMVSLVGSNSRGGETRSISARPGQPFEVKLDVPTEDRFTSYTCEVLAPSGTVAWRVDISPLQAKDTVSILIPGISAAEGDYTVVVRGNLNGDKSATGQEIDRHHFVLQRAP
jgi:hypothetical protein